MLMLYASRVIAVVLPAVVVLVSSIVWAETGLIDRIQEAEKSMVGVKTELTRVMPPARVATYERMAAGLVLDPSGIIITNTHTVIHAPFIYVILQDGSKIPAQVLSTSENYDLTFLKIHPPYRLSSISWADSSLAEAGQPVIAVGNSEYDGRSIMSGHIRSILQSRSSSSNDFFELDLDLYHGDSGGPVFDTEGRLLGMIMAKRESQPNSSLAIASNKIRQQYWQYKKNVP